MFWFFLEIFFVKRFQNENQNKINIHKLNKEEVGEKDNIKYGTKKIEKFFLM